MRKRPAWSPALLLLVFLLHPANAEVDFEKEILPIFEKKCVECHKAPFEENGRTKKPKAGLRMDAAWAILAGSENGKVLSPGDADDSEIYVRVTLPEDDDDFMPPVGKADPLTKDELSKLQAWITEGADFGEWEGNLEGKPKETTTTSAPPVSEVQQTYDRLAAALPEIEESAWSAATEAGARVDRLSPGSPLLSVDFRLQKDGATDESVRALAPFAKHIIHLDLSRTSITNEALALLADTPHLVRLNLSETGIGNDGVALVSGLKELRSLNLYGSAVGDSGIAKLKNLPQLEAIYLWQSEATERGARKLQQAFPDARIILD